MEYIKRMEQELEELRLKKDKALQFYTKEVLEHKHTDEIQRTYLALQIDYMERYITILSDRISYDKAKEGKKACSTSNNYGTATEECFK